jgi:hypothetical protein
MDIAGPFKTDAQCLAELNKSAVKIGLSCEARTQ